VAESASDDCAWAVGMATPSHPTRAVVRRVAIASPVRVLNFIYNSGVCKSVSKWKTKHFKTELVERAGFEPASARHGEDGGAVLHCTTAPVVLPGV
jgi:hypothetical protein